jgi:hypothetical protein
MNNIVSRTHIKKSYMQSSAYSGYHSAMKHAEHKCEYGMNQECTQTYAGQGQEI